MAFGPRDTFFFYAKFNIVHRRTTTVWRSLMIPLLTCIVLLLACAPEVAQGNSTPVTSRTANFSAVVEIFINATEFEKRLADALELQDTNVVVLSEAFGTFNTSSFAFTPSDNCSLWEDHGHNISMLLQMQCTRNFTFVFEGLYAESAGLALGLMNVTTAESLGMYSVTIALYNDTTNEPTSSTSNPATTVTPLSTTAAPTPAATGTPQSPPDGNTPTSLPEHGNNSNASGANSTIAIGVPTAIGVIVVIVILCYCAGRVARKADHHDPTSEDPSAAPKQHHDEKSMAEFSELYTYQQQHRQEQHFDHLQKWPNDHKPMLPSPALTYSDMSVTPATPELHGWYTNYSSSAVPTPTASGRRFDDGSQQYATPPPPSAPQRATLPSAMYLDPRLPRHVAPHGNFTAPYSRPNTIPTTSDVVMSPSQVRYQERMNRFAAATMPQPHSTLTPSQTTYVVINQNAAPVSRQL